MPTTTYPQNYKFTSYERDPETTDPNNGLDYSFARYCRSSLPLEALDGAPTFVQGS